MTNTPNPTAETLENLRPSTLPFDPADLVAMRVKPAQFARMCKVSKQAVSVWIKEGKITLGPDGLLDPAVASRQVFERTDPGRLRARIFKDAMAPYGDLQKRVRELEAERDAWQAVRHLYIHEDEIEERNQATRNAIAFDFDRLMDAHADGRLDDALDELWGLYFWRLTPDELSEGDEAA